MSGIDHSFASQPTEAPLGQGQVKDVCDAIVIGSGIGGLTVAALLAKHAGKRVLVLERHYAAGGFTHVFQRRGYEWDVGLHYIGGVNRADSETRAAFDHLTEGRLHWNPMPEVYDRVKMGERTYEFPAGVERFRERMKGYFPGEARAIDLYIAEIYSAVRASGLFFAEKAIPRPIARLIGGMLRFRFLRHSDGTTAQVLSRFTQNRELAAVLAGQWGNYGLPPSQSSFAMHAIMVHHYFEGAGYPIGGASEIASNIAPLIESAGGKIRTRAEVSRILIDRNNRASGVRMVDGSEIRAPIVISDAGAHNTFARLLPGDLPASLRFLGELRRIPPSTSHICLYLGLNRGEGAPEFDPSNLWIFPDSDHDGGLRRQLDNPQAPFPFLFISFPSAKDPSFFQRHPRRSTIEVVAPAPNAWFQTWSETRWKKRGADYEAFKESLAVRLVDQLGRHVPGTRGRVAYSELSTPLSTRHFANSPQGEIYGLSAVPARFRVRNLGVRTPVRNLYLTGQDACVAGVTGALAGGVIAASAILGRNLLPVVFRGKSGA